MKKPLSDTQLKAIESQKFGNYTGIVRRVAENVRLWMERARTVEAELQQLRDSLVDERVAIKELERARPDFERVLVVISDEGAGSVEVYGEKWIACEIVNLPRGGWKYQAGADEIVETLVSRPYHELMLPGNLRRRGITRCPSIAELKCSMYELLALEAAEVKK